MIFERFRKGAGEGGEGCKFLSLWACQPFRCLEFAWWGGGERAGRKVLPSNRLMGMCYWVGSHFLDWIGYNEVVFSMSF